MLFDVRTNKVNFLKAWAGRMRNFVCNLNPYSKLAWTWFQNYNSDCANRSLMWTSEPIFTLSIHISAFPYIGRVFEPNIPILFHANSNWIALCFSRHITWVFAHKRFVCSSFFFHLFIYVFYDILLVIPGTDWWRKWDRTREDEIGKKWR